MDILGVGAREDSYTDLLAAACSALPAVANHVAEAVAAQPSDHWQARTRAGVSHDYAGARRRSIPDLVLWSERPPQLILVENKLFSAEGWQQTERYGEAVEAVAKRFSLESERYAKHFAYLTLEGERAAAPRWTAVDWDTITQGISDTLQADPAAGSDTLRMLLSQLCERITWRSELTVPPNVTLCDWLNTADWSPIVNRGLRAQRAFDGLFEKSEFECWPGTVNQPGEANIPILLWSQKTWASAQEIPSNLPDDPAVGHQSFSVAFKLMLKADGPRLELQHEPRPYLRRAALNDSPRLRAGIVERRQAFLDVLHGKLTDGGDWCRPRRLVWVNAAEYVGPAGDGLSSQTTIGELQAEIRRAVRQLTPVVDAAISDVARRFPPTDNAQ